LFWLLLVWLVWLLYLGGGFLVLVVGFFENCCGASFFLFRFGVPPPEKAKEQRNDDTYLLRVVDVGRGRVVVPGLVVAPPAPRGVVVADGARVPSEPAAEAVPPAVGRLVVRAAVFRFFYRLCFVLFVVVLRGVDCWWGTFGVDVSATSVCQGTRTRTKEGEGKRSSLARKKKNAPSPNESKPKTKSSPPHRWLMTMSASTLIPASCSAVMQSRSSASVP
jgi:hypothetical protein